MIDAAAEIFLRACAQRGVDFSRTLMLGRQQVSDLSYAEEFFRGLGAHAVDSLDASDFEGATVIADLNHPLPQDLRRRFTAVFDGGTLEHVFDIATALRSCLDCVELGGHYIAISPANNWPGHGFYQFSPELIFRCLSPDAGYEIRGAFVAELRRRQRWFAIPDPKSLGRRLYWRNRLPTHIVVVARRDRLVDLESYVPQQSDYLRRWTDNDSAHDPTFKRRLKQAAPRFMYDTYVAVRRRLEERIAPPRFVRVSLRDLAAQIR